MQMDVPAVVPKHLLQVRLLFAQLRVTPVFVMVVQRNGVHLQAYQVTYGVPVQQPSV